MGWGTIFLGDFVVTMGTKLYHKMIADRLIVMIFLMIILQYIYNYVYCIYIYIIIYGNNI